MTTAIATRVRGVRGGAPGCAEPCAEQHGAGEQRRDQRRRGDRHDDIRAHGDDRSALRARAHRAGCPGVDRRRPRGGTGHDGECEQTRDDALVGRLPRPRQPHDGERRDERQCGDDRHRDKRGRMPADESDDDRAQRRDRRAGDGHSTCGAPLEPRAGAGARLDERPRGGCGARRAEALHEQPRAHRERDDHERAEARAPESAEHPAGGGRERGERPRGRADHLLRAQPPSR